jgi:hypothetical protein
MNLKSPSPRWFGQMIVIGFGTFILYFGCLTLVQGYNSQHWPQAEGVIRSATIIIFGGRNRGYAPKVLYDYQVGGISYSGSRVLFASYRPLNRYWNQADAQSIVDRYPQGKQVKVFYAPNNPHNSVLEPGISNSVLNFCGIGVLFIIFGYLSGFFPKRPN